MKNAFCILVWFATLALVPAAPVLQIKTNLLAKCQAWWDPSPSPDVTSYGVYMGDASGSYTNLVMTTNNFLDITLPARGVTFYFACQAYSSNGLVSVLSNEATFTAAPAPSPANMHNPSRLIVQSALSPAGVFADTPYYWYLDQAELVRFFRTRLEAEQSAAIASVAVKPAVKPLTRRSVPLPPAPGHE